MRQHAVCLGFLVLLSAALLPAQTATPTGADLEGEVTDAISGAPLAGARVRLDLGQDKDPLYLRTNNRGSFLFENLTPAFYTLSAESPGFLRAESIAADLLTPRAGKTPLTHPPGGTSIRSIGANGVLHVKVFFSLTAYAVIAGRVTDPEGLPIQEAIVEVFRREPAGSRRGGRPLTMPLPGGQYELVSTTSSLYTDDRGEFRAAHLPPGTYYIMANNPRLGRMWENAYQPTYFPNALNLADAKALELAAGQQERADVQIRRQSGVRISGRILKPGGEDAYSRLLSTNVGLAPDQGYLTNPNTSYATAREEYELKDVLPGRYKILAITYDRTELADGKPVFGASRPIEVGDRDIVGLDLAVEPLSDLPGVVAFRDGCNSEPLRIRASAISPFGWGQAEAISGADGTFVLSGLTPGKFIVSVTMLDRRPFGAIAVRLSGHDVLDGVFEVPFASDASLINLCINNATITAKKGGAPTA